MTDEEIERLAGRLAMVVSDTGESDNAGRAVGALARRLGVSGAQLKAVFMAGAESAGGHSVQLAEQAAHIERLRGELADLREAQRRTEIAARAMQRERDAMYAEVSQLQAALDSKRTSRQVRAALGLVVLLAIGGAGWLAAYGPKLHVFAPEQKIAGSPFYRDALVRDEATTVYRDPDRDSPKLATVIAGTHMAVRRVLWHNLLQWVEVQLASGETGYVLSSDVELS